MCHTDEQVEKYLNILNPVTVERKKLEKVTCKLGQSDEFFVKLGSNICEKCGTSQSHALGFLTKRSKSDLL